MSDALARLLQEDWSRPPAGTVRALSREFGITEAEAWARYGFEPPEPERYRPAAEPVCFSELRKGGRFHFNTLDWTVTQPAKPGELGIARCKDGPHPFSAHFASHRLVEPILEEGGLRP